MDYNKNNEDDDGSAMATSIVGAEEDDHNDGQVIGCLARLEDRVEPRLGSHSAGAEAATIDKSRSWV